MGRGPGVRVVGSEGAEGIQLDFRWKGARRRLRIRLSPTQANLKYCRAWKRRIDDEIALGTFVWERHFPHHTNPCPDLRGTLFRDAVLSYVASLSRQVQPETLKEYEQNAEIVAEGIGNQPLKDVTRAMLRTWVSKQTVSKSRIDNLLRPVRGALRQAAEDGAIAKNPLEGFEVRRIKQAGDKIDPFTPAEVAALGKTQIGYLWTFWAWTGLRSGEVIGLRRGDVDLDGDRLHVRRAVRRGREKTPKTDAGARVVGLLAPARAVVHRLAQGDPVLPLFTNPNTGGGDWYESRALNRAFTRACKAAAVRRRYAYQLRHTFATWALSAGENPLWVAKQLGHEGAQMLYEHYAKWMPQLDPKVGSRMLDAAAPKRKRRAA